MTKREKLRQKLRNPASDIDMRDVQSLLERFGFTLVRTRGSHHIFEYEDGNEFRQVVFPLHGNKVKRFYVKEIIAVIDGLFPQGDKEPDEDENP